MGSIDLQANDRLTVLTNFVQILTASLNASFRLQLYHTANSAASRVAVSDDAAQNRDGKTFSGVGDFYRHRHSFWPVRAASVNQTGALYIPTSRVTVISRGNCRILH